MYVFLNLFMCLELHEYISFFLTIFILFLKENSKRKTLIAKKKSFIHILINIKIENNREKL